MASPSLTPNGDSRFLTGLVKYWPILGGLVLVLGAYFSGSAQTTQNSKDIVVLQQNSVNKDQLQYLKDSLARIERNQDIMQQKLDALQARPRR